MSETYQMRSDDGEGDFKHSGEYTTYDGPDVADGPSVKGFNLLTSAAEQAGRFIELTIGDGESVTFDKATSRTAKYSGPGVRSIYISHDEMVDSHGATVEEDDMDFPESLGISVSPSSEDEFETAADENEAAEALLSGVGDSDAVEVEEEDDSEEEDAAEALLNEAEDAA